MKNCKSILFIAVSIIVASNNLITQSGKQILPPKGENRIFFIRLQNRLKFHVPRSNIKKLVTMGRLKFTEKKPNDFSQKLKIIREVIVSLVKINTRTVVGELTDDPDLIDNTVQVISNKAKARLEQDDCCLNGKALEDFFGQRLATMVHNENIRHLQPKCDVCWERNSEVQSLDPCPYSIKHSCKVCPNCKLLIRSTPPICPDSYGYTCPCPFHGSKCKREC